MEKRNRKVSIIVPAYNVETFVEKCINSLLDQTYENIEILIIDDGSTDKTGKIIDRRYSQIGKISIYHKENGGLSDARNYGLDRVTGDYVTFVDSDDFVDKKYIEYLMRLIGDDEAEIAVISPQTFFTYDEISTEFDYAFETVSAKEAARRMLLRKGIAHTACGKLYKKKLWDHLRFPLGKLYEDYYTTFDVFACAKKVSIGKAQMYFYFQRDTSIMHLKCNDNTVSIINATNEVTPRIVQYWPDLVDEAIDLQMALCLKCLQNIYAHDSKKFLKEQEKIKNIVNRNATRVIFSKKIGYKDKIKLVMSYFPSNIFLYIYNIFDGSAKRSR